MSETTLSGGVGVAAPDPVAGRLQLALLLAGSSLGVPGPALIAPVLPQIKDPFARTPCWRCAVAALLAVPMAVSLWQPQRDRSGPRRRLEPVPWRRLRTPCLVTIVGGVVFYALIVQLSFVLDDLGVSSTSAVGGIS